MKTTCGIFLIIKGGMLLVCHPTNSPDTVLSIPKGLSDDSECYWDAAIRELKEETGINLVDYQYHRYPQPPIRYKNKPKILISFVVFVEDDLTDKDLICTSFTKSCDPEVDAYYWLSADQCHLIQPEQYEVLIKFSQNFCCNNL